MLEWSTIFHVYKSPTHPLPSLELGYDCFRCMDHVDRRSQFFVSRKRASCETQSSFLPTL